MAGGTMSVIRTITLLEVKMLSSLELWRVSERLITILQKVKLTNFLGFANIFKT